MTKGIAPNTANASGFGASLEYIEASKSPRPETMNEIAERDVHHRLDSEAVTVLVLI